MKAYNYAGIPGCVSQSIPRGREVLVGLYHNAQAGLDVDEGPWSLVCEEHCHSTGFSSLSAARDMQSCPEEWCEGCGEGQHEDRDGNPRPLDMVIR